MPVSTVTSSHPDDADSGIIREDHIEYGFIGKLQGLKYQYRPDITNRATPTSFKASTLSEDNDCLQKFVLVVNRKDLDRQTREEFNHFQEGCVEENTNTTALVRRLLSEDSADKVIVTTIQKLGLALDETSKRNKQRKKNDPCFTRAPRFEINGASQAIQHYNWTTCSGG